MVATAQGLPVVGETAESCTTARPTPSINGSDMSETSRYSLVPPLPQLLDRDLSPLRRRMLVDYRCHPAYREMVDHATLSLRAKALWCFVRTWLIVSAKRALQYELIPLHVRKAGTWSLLKNGLPHLLRPGMGRHLEQDAPGLTELDRALRRQGCVVLRIDSADLERLERYSVAEFERLSRRRAESQEGPRQFEASRAYARRDEAAALFDAVESMLVSSGVMTSAGAYLGREARLVDVNPQINDPSDDFWKRIFPDGSITPPATAYLHRDASGGDLKAIVYMSDVGPDNGPFGFVLGSHAEAPSGVDDRICETNDSNGLAATDPQTRRLFGALPERLRQKGAVGNDLLDTTDVSRALRDALWSITGPAGSLVVFDTKGMHRGGMVTAGERRVLTCVIG